ncbi:RND family transporter [Zhongshania sp.]|uniref:efflux RND transporter permease subunit n=1 Tax=Zhongshania sp. TaxID=1971902 RepID=UPI003567AA5A
MQKLSSRLSYLFEAIPSTLRPYRWLCIALFIATSVVMSIGIAKNFVVNMSPEVWFEEGAAPLEIRNAFRQHFGSDEGVYIVYKPESGDVFSDTALRTLAALHQEIEAASLHPEPNELARIVQVDSLINARYQIADGDTLTAKKLIGNSLPSTDSERENRRAIALSQDSFARVFHSQDFIYGGIRLKTNFGAVPTDNDFNSALADTTNLLQTDSFDFGLDATAPLAVDSSAEVSDVEFVSVQLDEYLRFMTALRAITEQEKYAGFELHFVGNPVTMEFIMKSIVEAAELLLAMVALVVILLWLLFRSFSAVVWPLLVVVVSALWAIGLGSWLGMAYTTMLALTFMLVLAVGIASCVHVLSAYTLFSREGKNHEQAMSLAYRKTGTPILLTSLTTMVGMLALTLTDMPIIATFGITSALAVGFAFLLIFGLLPALLDIWHPRLAAQNDITSQGKKPLIDLQPMLAWIAGFTERRAKSIVVAYIGIFILLIYGALELKIDTNFSKLAREGTPVDIAMKLVDKDMMGGMGLEVFMDFKENDALKDPRVLQAISDLQSHIKDNYSDKVVKTLSLANIVQDSNQVMHNNDPSYHRIPSDPQLAAQLLYLFNNANPADRRELVSDNYDTSHISFMLRNAGTNEYTPFFDQLDRDVERIFGPLKADYPDMTINTTGTFHLMMELMDHVAWTQLKSFSFALIIITVLMILTLGSPQAGVISMIPNLLPAVFTFGVMGWFGVPLDSDTLLVAPIIIGLAVDDTIHFLTHYRYAWIESGNVGVAVRTTLREVGQAVVFTSLILGLGFAVLGFAGYLGLAKPGLFGALAIFVASLSDLLFLPALMHWLKPNLGRDKLLKHELTTGSQA